MTARRLKEATIDEWRVTALPEAYIDELQDFFKKSFEIGFIEPIQSENWRVIRCFVTERDLKNQLGNTYICLGTDNWRLYTP